MSDYTYQDLLRMQEEAKARVLEMRRRSRFLTEEFPPEPSAPAAREPHAPEPRRNGSPPDRATVIRMPVDLPREKPSDPDSRSAGNGPEPPSPEKQAAVPGAKNAARGSTGLPAALRNIFGSLGEEETEKMLILALCLLLSQENGDEGLTLALLYLLT